MNMNMNIGYWIKKSFKIFQLKDFDRNFKRLLQEFRIFLGNNVIGNVLKVWPLKPEA